MASRPAPSHAWRTLPSSLPWRSPTPRPSRNCTNSLTPRRRLGTLVARGEPAEVAREGTTYPERAGGSFETYPATGLTAIVRRTGRPAQVDDYRDVPGGERFLREGLRSAVGTLRVCVRDDGVGGADPPRGSGLAGLQDRIEDWAARSSCTARRAEARRCPAGFRFWPVRHNRMQVLASSRRRTDGMCRGSCSRRGRAAARRNGKHARPFGIRRCEPGGATARFLLAGSGVGRLP